MLMSTIHHPKHMPRARINPFRIAGVLRAVATTSSNNNNNSNTTTTIPATTVEDIIIEEETSKDASPTSPKTFSFLTAEVFTSGSASSNQTTKFSSSTAIQKEKKRRIPKSYWADLNNQRRFFDSIAKELNVRQLDDWYNVPYKDFIRLTSSVTVPYYGSSMNKALETVYPEHEWLPWRFRHVPKSFWKDRANHRRFFDWIARELRVEKPEDWYSVSREVVHRLGGEWVVRSYYTSLARAIMEIYPEYGLLPWRFSSPTLGIWDDPDTRRQFFEWAAEQLNVRQLDDWYKCNVDDIRRLGGSLLLESKYDNSLLTALSTLYPEHEWIPWRFPSVPRGFWRDHANHRRFFDWAGKQLNIRSLDDWYAISREEILNLGGSWLLDGYYETSQIKALMAVYPEHPWVPWRFSAVPQGFWKDTSNHRHFFEWVAEQLNVRSLDDWYDVTAEDIVKISGYSVLDECYNRTLYKALVALYPEHDWLPWRFKQPPKGIWYNRANHRRFLDWAAQQLGVRKWPDDWYNIVSDDVERLGGHAMLRLYKGSLVMALGEIYPEIEWEPWRFRFVSSKSEWTRDHGILQRYVEYLTRELHITSLEEWYRVSVEQVRKLGGYAILSCQGGLAAVLMRLYPHFPWDESRFAQARSKRSNQRLLRIAVQNLFPDEEAYEEYQHPTLAFNQSGNRISLDVFIPSAIVAARPDLAHRINGHNNKK